MCPKLVNFCIKPGAAGDKVSWCEKRRPSFLCLKKAQVLKCPGACGRREGRRPARVSTAWDAAGTLSAEPMARAAAALFREQLRHRRRHRSSEWASREKKALCRSTGTYTYVCGDAPFCTWSAAQNHWRLDSLRRLTCANNWRPLQKFKPSHADAPQPEKYCKTAHLGSILCLKNCLVHAQTK